MQDAVGNRGVNALRRSWAASRAAPRPPPDDGTRGVPVQARLAVSQPGDASEQDQGGRDAESERGPTSAHGPPPAHLSHESAETR